MMGDIFNFNNVVGVLINSFAHVYIWSILLKEKIDIKNIKYYLYQLLFAVALLINYFFINGFVRIISLILILILFSAILFKKNFKEIILISFFSEVMLILSEFIFAVVISLLYTNNANVMFASFAGKLFTNIMISLLAILLSHIPVVEKSYQKVLNLLDGVNEHNMVFIIVVMLISFNLIFGYFYQNPNLLSMLIINALVSIIYILICFKFLKAESKYYKINDKYNTTLNSLKEYEEILDVYRVSNHENKNQLLTIRSMIVKEEKNIPEYIDKIIDNKIKDDEKLMFDTNTIPAGGLRAVIYSKLLVMKDKKIKFNLNVDYKVRTVDLIELGEDLMLDICKVIGVFLDNAIEAVLDLKKKNITINLFTDGENLNIEISNNFEGNIDLTKIDDKGYTSKTKGHGYGLSLVKEIISKNSELKNERKINKNIFTQNLKIKIK